MANGNFGKKDFLDMVKRLNNSHRQPQEYAIYGGIESTKQMGSAITELMWFAKNPILDQPAQKWHHASGLYMVLKAFGEVKAGDVLLFDSPTHSRVVKIATATEKQVFYSHTENFNANMKFTPHEWLSIRPLTKRELLKIFPHLSDRIKWLHGYFAIMQFYPEYLCSDCIKLLNLEVKKGWEKWVNNNKPHVCPNCKQPGRFVTFRNALKPIGL